MSTLSSSSTWAQIKAAYDDNASYEEDSSVSKARAFVTACRIILRRMATKAKNGDSEVEFDTRIVQDEMKAAQKFVATVDPIVSQGSVIHTTFEDLR